MEYIEQQKQLQNLNLEAQFLSGLSRTGNDSRGTLTHATEKDMDYGKALCGKQESARSNGWYPAKRGDGTDRYEFVNCEKCLKKLSELISNN